MAVLIAVAFGFDSDRISGKQSWLDSESYDVTAKAEGGREIPRDQLKPMLQKLLADRFKLAVHRETKDSQGYALVIGKDGPKLRTNKGGPPKKDILRDALRGQNISLETFAVLLARPTHRPVVDQVCAGRHARLSPAVDIYGAAGATRP